MQTMLSPQPFSRMELLNASSLDVPAYFNRKRVVVRVLGGVFLVVALPVIAVLSILIRATSKGPAFFKQRRIGLNGEEFDIIKLRTMRIDAESAGPQWSVPGDQRVTKVGRVLRLLHLDELPQLINVMRGEMDLIGPRPERPEIIESAKLAEAVDGYHARHLILPGVTGLAQINLPPDQTIDCVHRKVELDIEYIRTASLALDLRILACTLLRMFGIRHGVAVRFFGLGRPAVTATASRQTKRNRPMREKTPAQSVELVGAGVGAARSASRPIRGDQRSDENVLAELAHRHPR